MGCKDHPKIRGLLDQKPRLLHKPRTRAVTCSGLESSPGAVNCRKLRAHLSLSLVLCWQILLTTSVIVSLGYSISNHSSFLFGHAATAVPYLAPPALVIVTPYGLMGKRPPFASQGALRYMGLSQHNANSLESRRIIALGLQSRKKRVPWNDPVCFRPPSSVRN